MMGVMILIRCKTPAIEKLGGIGKSNNVANMVRKNKISLQFHPLKFKNYRFNETNICLWVYNIRL
jgi:hypothetical protein